MMTCAEAEERLAKDGFCILENVLDGVQAERLDGGARARMRHQKGYVKLEGALRHLPELVSLCTHQAVLDVAKHSLGDEFYLANNVCMMWCQPGAPGGGLHSDWPLHLVPQPWPSWPLLLQTMWMLTEFTPDNGATRVVPGSHLLGRPPDPKKQYDDEIPVVGKRGSVLIWHGGLWHRNGQNNTSDQHRMGANIAYIPPVVHRPPDAWPLVPRNLYERFPARLQQLLVRSVETG